jgi:hypothetical protein
MAAASCWPPLMPRVKISSIRLNARFRWACGASSSGRAYDGDMMKHWGTISAVFDTKRGKAYGVTLYGGKINVGDEVGLYRDGDHMPHASAQVVGMSSLYQGKAQEIAAASAGSSAQQLVTLFLATDVFPTSGSFIGLPLESLALSFGLDPNELAD